MLLVVAAAAAVVCAVGVVGVPFPRTLPRSFCTIEVDSTDGGAATPGDTLICTDVDKRVTRRTLLGINDYTTFGADVNTVALGCAQNFNDEPDAGATVFAYNDATQQCDMKCLDGRDCATGAACGQRPGCLVPWTNNTAATAVYVGLCAPDMYYSSLYYYFTSNGGPQRKQYVCLDSSVPPTRPLFQAGRMDGVWYNATFTSFQAPASPSMFAVPKYCRC
mmetsp:Transcript_30524/g.74463  ORF Transcript_30524/g.74463 Transcript_30524/m.74463 type:complete len:220 (-) Transcript_30524:73-732(-)